MNKKAQQDIGSEDVTIQMNRDRSALIVANEDENRRLISALLKSSGYKSVLCKSIDEVLENFTDQSLVVFTLPSDLENFSFIIKELRGKNSNSKHPSIIAIGPEERFKFKEELDFIISSEFGSHEFLAEVQEIVKNISDSTNIVSGNSELIESAYRQKNDELIVSTGRFDEFPKGKLKGINSSEEDSDIVVVKRGYGKTTTRVTERVSSDSHIISMLDNCPFPMAIFDMKSQFILSNRSWQITIGHAFRDADGLGQFESISSLSKSWRLLCDDCLRLKSEQIGEELVKWGNGEQEWIKWHMRPWFDSSCTLSGFTVCCQSIQKEKQLKSKQTLELDSEQAIMSSSVIPVLILDIEGRIIRSNRAAKQLGDWDPFSEQGAYYWEVFLRGVEREKSKAQFSGFSQKLLNDQNFNFPDTSEDFISDSDGNLTKIIWSNSPKRGHNGKVNGLIRLGIYDGIFSISNEGDSGSLNAISILSKPDEAARFEAELASSLVELDRAKKRLSELEGKFTMFSDIANLLPSAVIVINIEGKVSYANMEAEKIMGSEISDIDKFDDWLTDYVIASNDEERKEIVSRWYSLVWSRGIAESIPVKSDTFGKSVLNFKPCIMRDGGVLLSIVDVTSQQCQGVKRLAVSEPRSVFKETKETNLDLLFNVLSDFDSSSMESIKIMKSRVEALSLLKSFRLENKECDLVSFGDYCSILLKSLIKFSPKESDPEVHINYLQLVEDGNKVFKEKISSSEVKIPMMVSMPLSLIINGIMKNIFENAHEHFSDIIVSFSMLIDKNNGSGLVSITHDGDFETPGTFADNFFGSQLEFIDLMLKKVQGSFELSSDLVNEIAIKFEIEE